MTRRQAYLAAVIRLYLGSPGAPPKPSGADWAVAATLHNRAVPLDTLAYAVRLATLRRARSGQPLEPIRSLAYYRRVLEQLTPEDLQPGYVAYVHEQYRALPSNREPLATETALSNSQNPALPASR